ncbi:MAG: hypothetical protein IE925_11720 [Rhodobacterales bacterium]|jgi:hypothetical protein|nr:hypothetical protein [Rhodobacterales bacterium]
MDAIDQIRRRIIKVLEGAEDACGQAMEAQLPALPYDKRLQESQILGTLLNKATPHYDKAPFAMLKYIRLQIE